MQALIRIITLGLVNLKKVEAEGLNDIVKVFHEARERLKALQVRHQAKITENNQQIDDLAAKNAAMLQEHDTAGAIHENISKNILGTN